MRKSLLYSLIAALIFFIGFEETRIFFLKDAVSARADDVYNCELDLQAGTEPRKYKRTKATIY